MDLRLLILNATKVDVKFIAEGLEVRFDDEVTTINLNELSILDVVLLRNALKDQETKTPEDLENDTTLFSK